MFIYILYIRKFIFNINCLKFLNLNFKYLLIYFLFINFVKVSYEEAIRDQHLSKYAGGPELNLINIDLIDSEMH